MPMTVALVTNRTRSGPIEFSRSGRARNAEVLSWHVSVKRDGAPYLSSQVMHDESEAERFAADVADRFGVPVERYL